MKINKIILSNFKGWVEQSLLFNGESATLKGANGAGKSRTIDGVCWLLTGKDSFGNSDFDIKPMKIGADGNPTIDRGPNNDKQIVCTVETEFARQNGTLFVLKRSYKENWVKPTGRIESEYRGNTTDYFIDGVPNLKKEYDAFVEKEFGAEQYIRLLINPRYFCEQTENAAERRAIIFSVFGDMTEEEVISGSDELLPLVARLEGRTIEGFEKMMKAVKLESAKEADSLPRVIDEANKSIVEGINPEQALLRIEQCNSDIAALKVQIESLGKDSEKSELLFQLAEKRRELERLETAYKNDIEDKTLQFQRVQETSSFNAKQMVAVFEKDIADITVKLVGTTDLHDRLSIERKTLLQEHGELNDSVFSADTVCPTCKQGFPEIYIDEMRGNWNEQKSIKLSTILANGKEIAKKISEAEQSVASKAERLTELNINLEAARTALQAVEIDSAPYKPSEVEQVAHAAVVTSYAGTITELESQLANFGTDDTTVAQKTELEGKIKGLEAEKAEHQQVLAQAEVNKNSEKRIAEYTARQKELVAIIDDCEKMLYLCNAFARIKANAVSENVNSHFKIINFQLFEKNESNDGLKEVCKVVDKIKGKSYQGSGMNNALMVAANIDIAITFGKKLGKSLPLFLDNAESAYNRYGVETGDTQVITLMAVPEGELEVVFDE